METNRACYLCCCCDSVDCVSKSYLDTYPFTPNCLGYVQPQFHSYKDSCYFLYFIPCSCMWDLFCKPCCGELVTIAPCYCDCCPYTCCIRFCSFTFLVGTGDSRMFTLNLMNQIKACNSAGAHEGAPSAPDACQAMDDRLVSKKEVTHLA